ncbi:MAG: molecular chaperone TorD family protein [Rhodocyclaceae bacterium]|nr:molecular chaperone TorD family protein [Rhodocyclaceae bacterium]
MLDAKEMQGVAAGRANTYAMLSALILAPPSKELTAAICEGGIRQPPDSALAEAANTLTECLRRAVAEGDSSDTHAEGEIAAEYTRLFVLPFGVVPNESFYVDKKKQVGGHVTVEVQQFYDEAAAQLIGTQMELADHMGVELEFMKFLCDLESRFWEAENEEGLEICVGFQRRFLEEHLLRWHQALGQKIIEDSALDLYRALARLTVDFLEAERGFVPALAQKICFEGWTPCLSES